MTAGVSGGRGGHDSKAGRGRSALEAYARARARLLALGGAHAEVRYRGGVAYLEAGSGPPLVLVQGGAGGGANWYRVLGRLAGGRRVLAPDLPGFGGSRPVEPRPPVGWQGAEILRRWLDGLGVDRFALVGTSLGGLVGLRLAQLLAGRLERLVLLSSAGLGRWLPWPVRVAALPWLGRLLLRPSLAGTRRVFRRYLTANRAGLPAEHEEALVTYLYRSERLGDAGFLHRALRAFAGPAGQRDVVTAGELVALGLPVLVCWGDRDRFFPLRHAYRAARCLPQGRLEIIPGAGHSPNWETPEAFLERAGPFLGL